MFRPLILDTPNHPAADPRPLELLVYQEGLVGIRPQRRNLSERQFLEAASEENGGTEPVRSVDR